MTLYYFVSDLHGDIHRYQALIIQILKENPTAVFLGGDLLPSNKVKTNQNQDPINNFINDFLFPELGSIKKIMGENYPMFFAILGNDDPKTAEQDLMAHENGDLLTYIHGKWSNLDRFKVFGYSFVPPTPFQLKDWEKYDVSRYLDPGCIAPEDGWHSTSLEENNELIHITIQDDLQAFFGDNDLSNVIILFHAPPYNSKLDRTDLDNCYIDYVPIDVHTGSVAIKNLIEQKQPLITLHGHIHESPRLTGSWMEKTGRTYSFSAAHDGPELALIRFDPENPGLATRELIPQFK
jgi:Icc-related predicted phosphoesterase